MDGFQFLFLDALADFKGLNADDSNRLQTIISSAVNLRQLTLEACCTNELLSVIGKHCFHLKEVNISKSPVTDFGLNLLTQSIVESSEANDENMNLDGQSKLWKKNYIFPPISHFMSYDDFLDSTFQTNIYSRQRNPLCYTLHKISLQNTYVTRCGLMMLLEVAPNLAPIEQSLSSLLLFLIETQWNLGNYLAENRLKLKTVYLSKISNEILRLASYLFPELCELKFDTSDPPAAIENLPILASLSCLHITEEYNSELSNYLKNKGEHLKKLSLTAPRGDTLFDLTPILQNCANLECFTLTRNVIFNDGGQYLILNAGEYLANLTEIELMCAISEQVIINVLKSARKLIKLLVDQLVNKSENCARNVCSTSIADSLKIFYVKERSYLTEREEDVLLFLETFQKIEILGHLPERLSNKFGIDDCSEDSNS